MLFPLYIAKRYLIAKKSHNIINIISIISVIGVMVGSGALIIVLSVFNGFEGLVLGLFNSFNPDLKITVSEGKSFIISPEQEAKIRKIPGIAFVVETVEENALARFGDKQSIVMMKGVSSNFTEMTPLGDFMVNGRYTLGSDNKPAAVIGAGVAYYLGIYPEEFAVPMSLYLPKRTRQTLTGTPDQSFNSLPVHVAGVFSIQQEFDLSYVIVPISLARELLEYGNEVTSLEIGLAGGAAREPVVSGLRAVLGNGYEIKDQYQQQATLYRVMKSEKWAVFFILAMILVIAAFNMIGSLSMLIVDKKKDIAVLWSLGAGKAQIRKIFFTEGIMISVAGGLLGLLLGGLLALLQQEFGLLRLGGGEGTYIVEAYPVKVQLLDFIYVMITVMVIGAVTTWYPVRQISRKYLSQRMNFFLSR
ncbi:MAG: FtsX-like permease family protein [Bacteroidales bacterium]|jgi:ABC-type lipoprotein release transport system permease subunit|nr:FtsX-like permease family protein [Bacteroidales bacterium]